MYSICIASAIALLVGLTWRLLDLWGGIGMALFLAFVAFFATVIVLGRRFVRVLQPVMNQVQKQIEARQPQLALDSVRSLLPLTRWIPMLEGQLLAQMGTLSVAAGDEERGIEYLERAPYRSAEAKMFLACLHYQRDDREKARAILAKAHARHKKDVLLGNTYAFVLQKDGQIDEAIRVLNVVLQKYPDNESTKDNVKRLKNGTKMNMKGFGNQWYALGLERPPQSMATPMGFNPRKGFRAHSKKR